MNLKFKKKWVILGAIFILLIVGNPTRQQLKDRFGETDNSEIRKKYNFLIFSIWEYRGGPYADRGVYLGALFNFFKIGGAEYL